MLPYEYVYLCDHDFFLLYILQEYDMELLKKDMTCGDIKNENLGLSCIHDFYDTFRQGRK